MSLTPTGSPAGLTFGAMPAGDYSPNTLQRERVQVRLEEFDIEGEDASPPVATLNLARSLN